MKTSTKSKLAITTVCIMLGIIITVQFRTIDEIDTDVVSTKRSQQIAVEYKKMKSENMKIKKEIDKLEKKIQQYENIEVNKDPFLENLHKDIEKYKMLSGHVDVKGQGVIIEMDNPSANGNIRDEENIMIEHYTFLLDIISLLNAVGTEAISINGQRYTSFTEIVPAGNLLEINGISFGTPVIIKAIGNSEDMENALRIKGGIIWLMEEGYNFNIKIDQKQDITIDKYEKLKKFKYAQPIEKSRNNP